MSDYTHALECAVEAAQRAGQLLRDEFHRPGGPRGAGGHAEIDSVAESEIRECLQAEFSWGIRGEELGFQAGDGGSHLWLVDPHDGTSVFLSGRRGSSVSIAALRDGVPVLGVVYAFDYPDDAGDLLCWAEGCGPLQRNGHPLEDRGDALPLGEREQVVLLWLGADRDASAALRCVTPRRYVALPSIAYRLARAAAGCGVAAVSINGPQGWDYAGGHALLRGVGGTLLNQRGEPIGYTRDGQSYAARCFGGDPGVVASLWQQDWTSLMAAGNRAIRTGFTLTRPTPGATIADTGVLRRAQGCLLGQFSGDSLGGQVEFQTTEAIQARFPNGIETLTDGGVWNILGGQPTDDSELALMLARTLVQSGWFDPSQVLTSYVHWLMSHPFDIGGTIGAALEAAAAGASADERLQRALRAANPLSQANGSLMRISPLGIFSWRDVPQAFDWACQDSRLTHPHPVCQEACGLFAATLASAVANGSTSPETYEFAVRLARERGLSAAIRDTLAQAADRPPEDYSTQQGWVRIALQNAFYQLLHATSLEQGIRASVMAGGDTDTNAAIAGALLGAVHGREAIPAAWMRSVLSARPLRLAPTAHPRPVELWPVDALELAEALLLARAA